MTTLELELERFFHVDKNHRKKKPKKKQMHKMHNTCVVVTLYSRLRSMQSNKVSVEKAKIHSYVPEFFEFL